MNFTARDATILTLIANKPDTRLFEELIALTDDKRTKQIARTIRSRHMARTKLDIDDNDSLDGADVVDQAPEPDDEDQRTRTHPRPAVRRMSQVPRQQRRPKKPRLPSRG